MTSWARSIEIPASLVVECGAMGRVSAIMDAASLDRQRPLVVASTGPTRTFATDVLNLLGPSALLATCTEGTIVESASVAAHAIAEGATSIVAVGGGKVVDTGKYAAARTGVPFVSVPTAVANDGISSPVASLLDRTGHRVSLGARMPAAVIVDLDVTCEAPAHLTAAGVGDLASNLVAVADWRLAGHCGRESYDEFAGMIGEAAGRMIWGFPSQDARNRGAQLARGLLLSGLAMATAGTSRPCSGGEHLVSHALDAVLGTAALPHGVQVALGTLLLAKPHGLDLPRLRTVMSSCGLPVTIAQAGIDLTIMVRAIELAPSMRPNRFTIIDELFASGVRAIELIDDSIR